MGENSSKIIKFKSLYMTHFLVYIFFGLVSLSNLLGYSYLDVVENSKAIFMGTTIIFLVMAIVEFVSYVTNDFIFTYKLPGLVYRIFQLLVFALYFFAMPFSVMDIACFTVIGLYCVEYVFIFNLEEKYKRIIMYGCVFIAFVLSILIEIIRKLSFIDGIIKLFALLVSIACVIIICELMARTYTYFDGLLMAQHRTVENLNEANEKLKEQKEKIKSVNEMLGIQKIELQTANKKINRSHDEMSVQNEISDAITSNKKQDDLCESICNILRIRLSLDMVNIIVEKDQSPEMKYSKDNSRKLYVNHIYDEEYTGFLKRIITEGMEDDLLSLNKTYIQNMKSSHNIDVDKRDVSQIMESLIMVPMTGQSSEKIGNLVVGKHSINAFMDNKTFYENIANQISIGIENMRLYERMHLMAILDGLTHILNRRSLTEELNGYLAEALKTKASVSLALFDIDKFKMVNDTYGHQCGDVVIQHVAELLDEAARENGGIAGRYGGEEFVIAFKGIDADRVMEIVTDVHSAIKAKEVKYEDKVISVKASAGVAIYPDTCQNPSELLARADWAMYHSKKNGRDRITLDSDEVEHML